MSCKQEPCCPLVSPSPSPPRWAANGASRRRSSPHLGQQEACKCAVCTPQRQPKRAKGPWQLVAVGIFVP